MTATRAALLADLALVHGTFTDDETGTEWSVEQMRVQMRTLRLSVTGALDAEGWAAVVEGVYSSERWYARCDWNTLSERAFLGRPGADDD